MQGNERSRRRWRAEAATQMRARQLRQPQTAAEAKLWYHLRGRQLDGFKFRRQHPIGRFIVDFCCLERRLVIEIDGPLHRDQQEYDTARTDALHDAGYTVLRYTNDQIDGQLEAVLADLRLALTSDDRKAASPSPAAAGEGAGG